jgi:hypothetical protein
VFQDRQFICQEVQEGNNRVQPDLQIPSFHDGVDMRAIMLFHVMLLALHGANEDFPTGKAISITMKPHREMNFLQVCSEVVRSFMANRTWLS